MVAGTRSPTTVIILVSLFLLLLLLWCTTTQPPTAIAIRVINNHQEDQHYYQPLSTHRVLISNRKVLSHPTKFDFTPFIHGHHHHHHHRHRHHQHRLAAAGSKIDPRYGVEMRLVPTGPNPLHH
ncbi:hypothetical protein Ccrd_015163 [Cynara cardunculus var. scolymus]|uniref:Uncharacterized protein n=2 Tax=Cynara cardunculus var. scolymus TaxID=59895 RepID=A0A103YCC5_CYNCS|nr:hypothetical protein Ccrd_015163 [Cynara cardunculus var. scolymus]